MKILNFKKIFKSQKQRQYEWIVNSMKNREDIVIDMKTFNRKSLLMFAENYNSKRLNNISKIKSNREKILSEMPDEMPIELKIMRKYSTEFTDDDFKPRYLYFYFSKLKKDLRKIDDKK